MKEQISGSNPNETQVGGSHYKDMAVQPWDAITAWLTPEQAIGFFLGSAIAYLSRYNSDAEGKGGVKDVEKARHYLDKLIQFRETL